MNLLASLQTYSELEPSLRHVVRLVLGAGASSGSGSSAGAGKSESKSISGGSSAGGSSASASASEVESDAATLGPVLRLLQVLMQSLPLQRVSAFALAEIRLPWPLLQAVVSRC